MNFDESLTAVQHAYKERSRERLRCLDFLGILRDRLAVLCVGLLSMYENYDAEGISLYVSRDAFAGSVVLLTCEELSRLLGQIDALLSQPESDVQEDGENACE